MTLTTNSFNDYQRWLIYVGLIGIFLAITITIIFLTNLIYQYYNLFYKHNSPVNKVGHILVIIYFIICLLQCIIFITIRTNIFKYSSYTEFQCESGFIAFWILNCLHLFILCVIFLYRIKIVFEGSAYQYEPYIFKTFYAFIVIVSIAFISMMITRMKLNAHFLVLQDDKFNIISMCGLLISRSWSNMSYTCY